tara:strand:- start:1620 stop:2405 length:786 start_codon:yes stop_codon:yes gene_type:complete
MIITLFTSNNNRHNYLANLLSTVCDKLWIVQETKSASYKKNSDINQESGVVRQYFSYVADAQNKFFKNQSINKNSKNIKTLSISNGELSNLSLSFLSDFLKSDMYVVFGSSYIRGDLADHLVKNKAVNIHAGVSPYYRGTDCNFWALYDNNPHLVGATIHMLSKGLDSGPVLYHAMSNLKSNPFEYTMSTIKSAFHSIADRIKDRTIFNIEPEIQDKTKEIRYTKKNDFDEKIVKNYFKKEINLEIKEFDISLLKNPYFLK